MPNYLKIKSSSNSNPAMPTESATAASNTASTSAVSTGAAAPRVTGMIGQGLGLAGAVAVAALL
jgi:hypothetical protein